MRVLLVSEGKHEGQPAEEKPQALQALVQRVLPAGIAFERVDVTTVQRRNPLHGKGEGFFKLAMRAMIEAQKNRFDGIVLLVDADRDHDRIRQFSQAQEDQRSSIRRALGVAVEAFDAWILADHQAMSQVLAATVQLQKLPETLAGGKGSANHPKHVCRQLMNQHRWNGSQAKFYEAVCRCADLDVVAERCPTGFAPFLQRLQALANNLPARR